MGQIAQGKTWVAEKKTRSSKQGMECSGKTLWKRLDLSKRSKDR